MFQEPLAADFAVPVKSPLLAVMVTSAIGARVVVAQEAADAVLERAWFDGDGVGDGEVAWMPARRRAGLRSHGGKDGPHSFQQSAAPSVRQASGCASQIENLHLGVVWVAPLQPLRTSQGTEVVRDACGGRSKLVISVTLLGLCYSAAGHMNAAVSRPGSRSGNNCEAGTRAHY